MLTNTTITHSDPPSSFSEKKAKKFFKDAPPRQVSPIPPSGSTCEP
jgi:hypothetical protein